MASPLNLWAIWPSPQRRSEPCPHSNFGQQFTAASREGLQPISDQSPKAVILRPVLFGTLLTPTHLTDAHVSKTRECLGPTYTIKSETAPSPSDVNNSASSAEVAISATLRPSNNLLRHLLVIYPVSRLAIRVYRFAAARLTLPYIHKIYHFLCLIRFIQRREDQQFPSKTAHSQPCNVHPQLIDPCRSSSGQGAFATETI